MTTTKAERRRRRGRRPRRGSRALSNGLHLLFCVYTALAAVTVGSGVVRIATAEEAPQPKEDKQEERGTKNEDVEDTAALASHESASPSPASRPLDDVIEMEDSSEDDDADSDDDSGDDENEDDTISELRNKGGGQRQQRGRRTTGRGALDRYYGYDSLVMDPYDMFGSPLGGFGRDVSSRLASLPLYLPASSSEMPPNDGVYLQVRDAYGQLFACRVYHQDELDPSSYDDGLFEMPRLSERRPNVNIDAVVNEGIDGAIAEAPASEKVKGLSEAHGAAAGAGDKVDVSTSDATTATGRGVTLRARPDDLDVDVDDVVEGAELPAASSGSNSKVDRSSSSGVTTNAVADIKADGSTTLSSASDSSSSSSKRPVVDRSAAEGSAESENVGAATSDTTDPSPPKAHSFTKDDVEERLAPLEGACVHIHLGWWSTEWCYKTSVRQFHVHVEQKDTSKLPHQVEITDITQLGQFDRRRIEMLPPPTSSEVVEDYGTSSTSADVNTNLPPNPLAGRQPELARVLDVHSDGDVCDATGQPRSTLVQILCCSKEVMDGARQFPLPPDADPSSIPPVALYGVYEDTDKLCNYVVTVCTSLLCDESSLTPVTKKPNNKDGTLNQGGSSSTSSNKARRAKTASASSGDADSIRGILDQTLGDRCLDASTDGWWSYSYCHGDRITQYHEVLEAKKSRPGVHVAERRIEAEHLLGVYQPDVTDSYPNHDEWRHVVNATDKRSRGGGTGTYFEIEYTNGDVCDHSDVTDAAIIAGGAAGGAAGGFIARASTVRFFCGKAYLLAVSEDSTCHYIVEVTVPALCQHPVFKEPIMKKQIVKCLPVDEDNQPHTDDDSPTE